MEIKDVDTIFGEIESVKNEFLTDLNFISQQVDDKIDQAVDNKVVAITKHLNEVLADHLAELSAKLESELNDVKANSNNSIVEGMAVIHDDLQGIMDNKFTELQACTNETLARSKGIIDALITSTETKIRAEIAMDVQEVEYKVDKIKQGLDNRISEVKCELEQTIDERIRKELTWKNIIKILLGVRRNV